MSEEPGTAVVVGPLVFPALLAVAVGFRRRRPVALLAGGALLGLAVKIVPRDSAGR